VLFRSIGSGGASSSITETEPNQNDMTLLFNEALEETKKRTRESSIPSEDSEWKFKLQDLYSDAMSLLVDYEGDLPRNVRLALDSFISAVEVFGQ
jgi:hypothetical protein